MRRQTLFILPFAAGLLAVMLGLSAFFRISARRAMDPRGARPVAFGSVSLPLPAAFRPLGTRMNRAWSIQAFEAPGVGDLQLSAEPLDGTSFEATCIRWFGLPAWPSAPLLHRGRSGERFLKPLPLFERGALSIHKEGKRMRLAACFDAGGHRHWVELLSSQGFRPQEEVFDTLLMSLRDAEGQGSGPSLGAALAAVPAETGHRFLLPLEILLIFPALVLLLPLPIMWVLGRASGRLPEEAGRSLPAAFRRPFTEVGLVGGGQWKFFVACVSVREGGLLLHTFGTPFLRIPKAAIAGRMRVGRGWISPGYLELPLDPPAEFLKRRWLYGLIPGRFRLRVYTADLDALRMALGT